MRKINAMAGRIARRVTAETESDVALKNIDEAVDNIIASIIAIEENLPEIKADTVSQKAALDAVKELMDEAVNPYFADVVKALQVFDA
jgi:hypothetical protein